MTRADFEDLLYDDIVLEGPAFTQELYRSAKEAVRLGKGTVAALTSSGANGKNFTRSIVFSPAEVMAAAGAALRRHLGGGVDDTEVASTLPDFRSLSR